MANNCRRNSSLGKCLSFMAKKKFTVMEMTSLLPLLFIMIFCAGSSSSSSLDKKHLSPVDIFVPNFAVEPNNVRVSETSTAARSAVFTCLLAQPPPDRNRLIASSSAAISWYYNGRQVDSVTDKIRIPLANGSLYVSAAAAEHPTPSSPLADVPLPAATKGYNCRATSIIDYSGRSYNATLISRVAHVVRPAQTWSTTSTGTLRPQRHTVRIGEVVVLVCGGGSVASSSANSSSTLIIGADSAISAQTNSSEGYVWFRDDVPFPDEAAASSSSSSSSLPSSGNSRSVSLIDNGRIVEFAPVSAEDFGEYACSRATVAAEQRRTSIISRFIISQTEQLPPPGNKNEPIESANLRFLVRPSDRVTFSTSSTASILLLCSAAFSSSPSVSTAFNVLPSISWLKDGATILNSDESRVDGYFSTVSKATRYRKVGHGSLLISPIHPNDTGLYTCRASSSIGSPAAVYADVNVIVNVVEPPRRCAQQTMTAASKAIVASTGGAVEIECFIENAVNFYWFHNGNYLPPTSEVDAANGTQEFFYEYGQASSCGRSLSLWALADSDSGIYQCFGVNAAGLVSTTTLLIVDQPPSILSNDSSGFDFASPAATVLRDEASDDKLKQPTNLHATSRSATTLRLAWDAPQLSDKAIVSGYVVLLRSTTASTGKTVAMETPGDSANRLRRLFAANTELLVDRLAPGRKYEVSVAVAFKFSGQTTLTVGAMSNPIMVTTETSSSPSNRQTTGDDLAESDYYQSQSSFLQQPRNLKAELKNPTTVNLVWQPPAPPAVVADSGKLRSAASTRSLPNISRYRLFYRSGGSTPVVSNNTNHGRNNNNNNGRSQQDAYIDLPGHQTTHVLTSLQPNTPYTFYVRAGMAAESDAATASVVLGPASRDVTIWTPSSAPTGTPQKVEATATSPSSLSVRWQPPLVNLQNGLITGYKVIYQSRSKSSPTPAGEFNGRTALTDGITTVISLKDGVAPSTEFEIRVAAINVNGTGPLSDSVFVKTPEQQLTESSTPGAPYAFTARAPSPSQIILNWQPPSTSGSILVRGYYISFGVGEPYRNQVMVDASKTEHVLTNLRPSSEYIISLRSYNNYGYGPEVFQAVRTPQLTSQSQSQDGTGDGKSSGSSRSNEVPGDEAGGNFDNNNEHQPGRQSSSSSGGPLAVPLGVKAFTLSDSAMLVSWTDPNEHSYRSNSHHQRGNKEHHVIYTVRYGPLISPQPPIPGTHQGADASKTSGGNMPAIMPMRWRLVNSTLPSVRVHSLEPFQEYEFAVRIVRVDSDYPSRQQMSDWSMSATNRTLDAPPADTPREIKVVEVPSSANRGSAVRVSWQPPLKPNGVISNYVVFYSAHSPSRAERDWQVIGVGGDRVSVLIRRLQPDTTYYFKVQAKNSRGYGPASMPPVQIRTALQAAKPVVLGADEETGSRPSSTNRHGQPSPPASPASQQQNNNNNNNNQGDFGAEDESWPFDPSFFENHVMPRGGAATTMMYHWMSTTEGGSHNNWGVTTPKQSNSRESSLSILESDGNSVIGNAGANTLWLAVSAAVGALLVCTIASIAVFVCRKLSSPRNSSSKLMSKSDSMGGNGNGRLTSSTGSAKTGPSSNGDSCNGSGSGLPSAVNADMWAMRDHLELRQQLISSAELQSTIGVGGGMSVLGMSDDNLMPPPERGGSSARHMRSSQPQDSQGTIRPHLYHIDPYETETIIIGGDGVDHARQTSSSIMCSPPMAYRHQHQHQHQLQHQHQQQQQQQQANAAAVASGRLFGNSRTSTATLSCQNEAAFPLLSNNHGGIAYHRHSSQTPQGSANDGGDDYGEVSSSRMSGMPSYHIGQPQLHQIHQQHQHHHHLLQHQQHQVAAAAVAISRQQQHLLATVNHQTLPRLSIATMPSPGPNSMHRYEPLLTTTSNDSRTASSGINQGGYLFCQPPSAQTPDSGFDDHQLHHQLQQQQQQQQRQRASLSSSSYGGGSISSSIGGCGKQQQQLLGSAATTTTTSGSGVGGDSSSPSSLTASATSATNERPRLSSFQPLNQSSNGNVNSTPTSTSLNNNGSANKTSFLHLSRVLPPTPGQVRSLNAATSASSASADRTSSATLSSSSPLVAGATMTMMPDSLGMIHLPPAPPELHSTTATDDELAAAAELSCLDGLIKDLKLNVATSSSATLTGNNHGVSSSSIVSSSNGSSSNGGKVIGGGGGGGNSILTATSKLMAAQ